jgi:hypothetical protein
MLATIRREANAQPRQLANVRRGKQPHEARIDADNGG